MVREERIHPYEHLDSAGSVEHWFKEIRARIPSDAVLSATVRVRPEKGFLASFRLQSEGEVISSEARAETAEMAVEEAGRGLCQHLPLPELRGPEIEIAS